MEKEGPKSHELNDYLRDFLLYLNVERQLSNHTSDAYHRDIKQFIDFLGHLSLQPKHLTLYGSFLGQSGITAKTVMRKQSSLKVFCKFLFQENRIDWKATPFIVTPKLPKSLPQTLKYSHINKMIDHAAQSPHCPYRNTAIIEILYSCGLRISECLHITLADFNMDKTVVKVRGKGKKQRLVPLGSKAKRAIENYMTNERAYLSRDRKSNCLFLTRAGKPFSRQGLYLVIKNIMVKSGLNATISPHTIRHTFATHLLEGDANVREVQELLGHENIKTTQIYTKVSQKRLKKVYNKSHPKA